MIGMCQDNQWGVRKVCAEWMVELGTEFSESEIKDTFSKEISELIEDEEIIV